MTKNKQLPLPVVLWLCGWKPNETNFKYSMKLDSYWIDALDGFDRGPADDRDCFWATVRSMEQMAWAKKERIKTTGLFDISGKRFELHSYQRYGVHSCICVSDGQTPWDCLTAMVSEIYNSGACK